MGVRKAMVLAGMIGGCVFAAGAGHADIEDPCLKFPLFSVFLDEQERKKWTFEYTTYVSADDLPAGFKLEELQWYPVVLGDEFAGASVVVPQMPGLRFDVALRFAVKTDGLSLWLENRKSMPYFDLLKVSLWRDEPSDLIVGLEWLEGFEPVLPSIVWEPENRRYRVVSRELSLCYKNQSGSRPLVEIHPFPKVTSRSGLIFNNIVLSLGRPPESVSGFISFFRDVSMLKGSHFVRPPIVPEFGFSEQWLFTDELLRAEGISVEEHGELPDSKWRKPVDAIWGIKVQR
jgi:hypothetical protein